MCAHCGPESGEAGEGIPPPASAPGTGVGAEVQRPTTSPIKSENARKCSDVSSPDEEGNSLHAQRLGIDIPLDSNDEELLFQAARIFKIENLSGFKNLKVCGAVCLFIALQSTWLTVLGAVLCPQTPTLLFPSFAGSNNICALLLLARSVYACTETCIDCERSYSH